MWGRESDVILQLRFVWVMGDRESVDIRRFYVVPGVLGNLTSATRYCHSL
jgi:hypothetical protein